MKRQKCECKKLKTWLRNVNGDLGVDLGVEKLCKYEQRDKY